MTSFESLAKVPQAPLSRPAPQQPSTAFGSLFTARSQCDQSDRLREALQNSRLVDEVDCMLLYLNESLEFPFKARWERADRTEETVEVEEAIGASADGVVLRVSGPELPPGSDCSSEASFAASSHGTSQLSPGALADGSRAAPAHQLFALDPRSVEGTVLEDYRAWRRGCGVAHGPSLHRLLEDLTLYKHGARTWPPMYEDVLQEFRRWPSFGAVARDGAMPAEDPAPLRAEVRARYLAPGEAAPSLPDDYTATLFLSSSRERLARVIPPRTPLRDHVRCLHSYFGSALAFPFVAAWRETHVWVRGLRPPSALGVALSATLHQSAPEGDAFPVPAHELRAPAEAGDTAQARVLADYALWHASAILVPRERLDCTLSEFDAALRRDHADPSTARAQAAAAAGAGAPPLAAAIEAARVVIAAAAAGGAPTAGVPAPSTWGRAAPIRTARGPGPGGAGGPGPR
eukprot:tig00020710_g13383.t1